MGQFSWFTSDKNERIVADETVDIYMSGSDHQVFHQKTPYEGYGEFGGKDFYEYLAELNDLPSDRGAGIELAYSGKKYDSPKLFSVVENVIIASSYPDPKTDPNQGFS